MAYLGESCALATAVCWTVSATAFSAAGRRMGPLTVNVIRLALALGFLGAWGWVVRRQVLPLDATGHQWLWLSFSGLVGLTLGDLFLFRAFVDVGPRVSMLMMTLAPPMTALLAWGTLGETVSWWGVLGIAVTVAGVGWVVLEEQPAEEAAGVEGSAPVGPGQGRQYRPEHRVRGLFFAFLGAAGQAGGLVLSKVGMGTYDAFAATEIRMIAGMAGFLVLVTVMGWWPVVGKGMRNRGGMGLSVLGAVFGPFLGVSLSLMAVQYTQTGIAATLMSIVPILLIPVAIVEGEKVTWRAAIGAGIAVAGVAMLFIR